jgi:hypothetical protein
LAANPRGTSQLALDRPAVAANLKQLVVRMATENATWGYTRLVGALGNLGLQVDRNTVKLSSSGTASNLHPCAASGCDPYGAWMTQAARNLTDGVDGF